MLVTRPEPGAGETAARVAALGWRPLLAPALALVPRPVALPPAQALLLASRAAARALAGSGYAGPVLAVGDATAAEARAAGLGAAIAAAGDAAALAALAAARLDPAGGPLLLAVGAGYGGELARRLRGHGFAVHRRIVYAARPAEALPAGVGEALLHGRVAAALFFSPRSAQVSITLLRDTPAMAIGRIAALAISARVADTLAALPWRRVATAARPTQEALLALLHRRPARQDQAAAAGRPEEA